MAPVPPPLGYVTGVCRNKAYFKKMLFMCEFFFLDIETAFIAINDSWNYQQIV